MRDAAASSLTIELFDAIRARTRQPVDRGVSAAQQNENEQNDDHRFRFEFESRLKKNIEIFRGSE
jgi:hypothetical protein